MWKLGKISNDTECVSKKEAFTHPKSSVFCKITPIFGFWLLSINTLHPINKKKIYV